MISEPTPQAIRAAVDLLARGELVAFPTETVYGLGADVLDDAAVRRIYDIKGRPPGHPLLVHVHGRDGIDHFAARKPEWVDRLVDAFWPGPLSIVLPRRANVAAVASGGLPTVGIRCPSHPVARQLLKACEELRDPILGLPAPSANHFGRVSPTRAAHVTAEFGDRLFVLDGGACDIGIESTIIDCTRDVPVILRPGAITGAQIEQATGIRALSREEVRGPVPQVSGSLEAHYAPRARVVLYDRAELQAHLLSVAQPGLVAAWGSPDLHRPDGLAAFAAMPRQPLEAARDLYDLLRRFDDLRVLDIAIELPPPGHEWDGVRDRLLRAAAAFR